MSALNRSQRDITAYDGTPVRLVYDQEADILEIFFGANEPATGVELTDHIILRLNQQTKRAVSLLLLDFSILTERAEYGPRSYPRIVTRTGAAARDLRACQSVFEGLAFSGVANRARASHLR